ncbi:MAG: PDZ domain-containing protein [Gemmataceae bacterium]|nr:PDZ domain-containing protein [Gemmataceae bacterium]
MIRKTCLLAFTAASLLSFANVAQAQIILPQTPRVQIPKIEGLPADLQAQLEHLLDPAFIQKAAGGKLATGAMTWGGVQLKKVTPELQEKLGLPENEGLLVAAVGVKSVGEKAGLKANDVLFKINNKAVPSEATAFITLVRNHKAADPLTLTVVRDGNEETIKGVKMPVLVKNVPKAGGGVIRPGVPGIVFPRIDINPKIPNNPFQPGVIDNLHLEMTINGAKVIRKQKGNEFSSEYAKDELKITISGKVENGLQKPSEIIVTEGKGTKKYTSLKEVPAQHRPVLQQLMASPFNMLLVPTLPDVLRDFPGILPAFPDR